jgi:hypothetical protein
MSTKKPSVATVAVKSVSKDGGVAPDRLVETRPCLFGGDLAAVFLAVATFVLRWRGEVGAHLGLEVVPDGGAYVVPAVAAAIV